MADPTENNISIVIAQKYLVYCLRVHCHGSVFTQSLPSNGRLLIRLFHSSVDITLLNDQLMKHINELYGKKAKFFLVLMLWDVVICSVGHTVVTGSCGNRVAK
jgi:hypothetical protein